MLRDDLLNNLGPERRGGTVRLPLVNMHLTRGSFTTLLCYPTLAADLCRLLLCRRQDRFSVQG